MGKNNWEKANGGIGTNTDLSFTVLTINLPSGEI